MRFSAREACVKPHFAHTVMWIYKLNVVFDRKSLLTGGQSVLANKEHMEGNDVFLFKIYNDNLHRQSADNYSYEYPRIHIKCTMPSIMQQICKNKWDIVNVINVKRSMSFFNEL